MNDQKSPQQRNTPHAATYKDAGVDIQAADQVKSTLKSLAKAAGTPGVLNGIGAFGGLFKPDLKAFHEPVLVASADGIGTKVIIARKLHRYADLGLDIVNHCVNDIGVMGAEPLFFLDYLAFGRLSPDAVTQIVGGISRACQLNGCALLGGETAEMPDVYGSGEFDIAGFIVGVVDRGRIIDGTDISPGDCVLGVASNGLHTNGYSLVRKVLFDSGYDKAQEKVPWADDETLGNVVLRPHASYSALFRALRAMEVKGMAHITGGGLPGNLVRILPDHCRIHIDCGAWKVPPLFTYIQQAGNVETEEMFRVFNMGIGLALVCDATQKETLMNNAHTLGFQIFHIGEVTQGEKGVALEF